MRCIISSSNITLLLIACAATLLLPCRAGSCESEVIQCFRYHGEGASVSDRLVGSTFSVRACQGTTAETAGYCAPSLCIPEVIPQAACNERYSECNYDCGFYDLPSGRRFLRCVGHCW